MLQYQPQGGVRVEAPPGSMITLPAAGALFLGVGGLIVAHRGSNILPPCSVESPHVIMTRDSHLTPPPNKYLRYWVGGNTVEMAAGVILPAGTAIVVPHENDDSAELEVLDHQVTLPRAWTLPKQVGLGAGQSLTVPESDFLLLGSDGFILPLGGRIDEDGSVETGGLFLEGPIRVSRRVELEDATSFAVGAMNPADIQLPDGVVFGAGQEGSAYINVPAGTVIAAGATLPAGTFLPGGSYLAAGTVLPGRTVIRGPSVLSEGTILPAGTILNAGLNLPKGCRPPRFA